MTTEREVFLLPDDLPGRAGLVDLLLKSGVTPVSSSTLTADCEKHFSGLFNHVPISIWEEDFSRVKNNLDTLKAEGVTDLESFIHQNPGFVKEMVKLVEIISVNQTGLLFYGAKTEDELLHSLSPILHDDGLDLFKKQLLAIWQGQTSFNEDGINYSIFDQPMDVNVRWVVYPGHEETYSRILVIVLDIFKQRQMQQALKISEERYQVISEISSDFAFSMRVGSGSEFKIEWVTDSFTQLTGFTIQDVVEARSVDLFVHPEDRSLISEAQNRILLGRTEIMDLRFITKANEIRWVHIMMRLVQSSSPGQAPTIVGAVQDITERKLAELALQEAQQQLHQRIEELEQRTKEITLLTSMTNNLQLCRSSTEACEIATEAASQLFPHHSVALYLRSMENQLFQLSASWGNPPVTQSFLREDCWALRRLAPFLVQGEHRSLVCGHTQPLTDIKSSLCMPVIQQGNIIGLFTLQASPTQPEINPNILQILSAMAEQFGLALSNIHLRDSLSEQALHDPLTGLYNRYYMEEFLEKELHRARRSNKPVAVIMIDMDHFRDLNSLFGHPNVDITLAEVGELLVHSIRAGDIACRYGGDEFLLILPEASLEVARDRAEQLCLSVHSVSVRSETRPPQPISFSVGIACFPQHGQSVTELLRSADSAVFSAKDRGRNRVEIAPENL